MAIESFGPVDSSFYTNNINEIKSQLVSGSKINHTADDPAGAAIVSALTTKIKSDDIAIKNANTGVSLLQTADSAATEISNQLQKLNELSIQSQNGTYSDAQRATINQEFTQGLESLNQIAENTQFNGRSLLNAESTNIDITLNDSTSSLTLPDLTLNALGLTGLNITSPANATQAQNQIATAFGTISSVQGQFGAEQNGLSSAVNNLANQNLNTLSSKSQINDTDFARAVTEEIRQQILNQASIALQSQGNQDYKNNLVLLS